MRMRRTSQEEIFSAYGWHEKNNLLNVITSDRCDYIEARLERFFGKGAFAQQEILEIGCGGGLICEELARRGAFVIGTDPAEGALQEARRSVKESHLAEQTYFERANAEALPYADGSFSAIVCLDVLEHVQDLSLTISEISRVLAPGGIFIFDTINRTFLSRLALIWIGERFFRKQGLVPGLHDYHAFIKPAELRTILTNHGLNIQELTGFMPHFTRGRLMLAPGWFTGVSYIGYATRGR